MLKRWWLVAGAVISVAVVYACSGSSESSGITPITGIQIRADSLVAGRGCGRGAGQVYKYTAIVSYKTTGAVAATATYDCFADGLFQNLPASRTGDFAFVVKILAYNTAAYEAQAGAITDIGLDPATFASVAPTWATSCTATQQSNIEVIAVCDPLALGPGEGAIAIATGAFLIPVTTAVDGGGVATNDHGCGDPLGYTTVEAALSGSLVPETDGGADAGTRDASGDGGDAAVDSGAPDSGGPDAQPPPLDAGTGADGGAVVTASVVCPTPIVFTPLAPLATYGVDVLLRHDDGSAAGHTTCTATTSPGVIAHTACAPVTPVR